MNAPGAPAPPAAMLPAQSQEQGLRLLVDQIEQLAPDVRGVRLVHPDGLPLPSFTPGSHVFVECRELRNAYSLTGPSEAPAHYGISVRLAADGAGGSRWLHESLSPGQELVVSHPRSAFAPVRHARKHLFVAGGIGITPLLSHVRAATKWGDAFALLYAHRPESALHVDALQALCGEGMQRFLSREQLRESLSRELLVQPLGTHLYACGPATMIEMVLAGARAAGWPGERVHSERFSVEDLGPGRPFYVLLTRSGRRLHVPAGVSLLEALEAAEVAVPSLCRQGVCGECRVGVLAGAPEHRDLYLAGSEREAGDSIMCCVSRCLGDELELEL